MRVTAAVTSVSWIPSEAVGGVMKVPFVIGFLHWDPPPPERVRPDDLDALRAADRFRFANELRAWIDVDDDGRITDAGYAGGGHMGATTLKLAGVQRTVPAIGYPDIRHEPDVGDGWVRFVQTTGGRPGVADPRMVNRPPYVQISGPAVWTTLALTLHADGTAQREVVGASPFPRHWIYYDDGALVAKSGVADFRTWHGESFGAWSPWGGHEYRTVVAEAESTLERQLSAIVMRGGAKPKIRRLRQGATLTEQGAPGDELYLVLDGMLTVEVDGEAVAEVGPGAILGERAVLEGGTRTSTLRADTACRVAVARADQLDRDALRELAEGHRREEHTTADG
jgi:Cyclic nucleotide-binding domain